VPADGGGSSLPAPVLLTPGAFEVEAASLSADGAQVLYSSNQGHLERLHLWRVPVAGGSAPVALTEGTGIETTALGTSDGRDRLLVRSVRGCDAGWSSWARIRDLAPGSIPTALSAFSQSSRRP
jgi:hypothetical protein